MNMTSSVDLDMEAPFNPCIGCTSRKCKACDYSMNIPDPKEYDYRVPRPQKEKDAKTQPAVKKETEKKPAPQKRKSATTVRTPDLLPVLGNNIKEYMSLPTSIFGDSEQSFVIRVDGNGMINAGIHTGDWLVFDARPDFHDGDIALVRLNGESLLCRRVFHEADKTRIRREDGVTPDVVAENCVVYAVLVGLLRAYRDGCIVDVGGNSQ